MCLFIVRVDEMKMRHVSIIVDGFTLSMSGWRLLCLTLKRTGTKWDLGHTREIPWEMVRASLLGIVIQ